MNPCIFIRAQFPDVARRRCAASTSSRSDAVDLTHRVKAYGPVDDLSPSPGAFVAIPTCHFLSFTQLLQREKTASISINSISSITEKPGP
ncbi:hypothetical protein [Variovorax paradoxus]|uniref:hypothetical protein n=1 Tax=Variovorax paradoxus TaxID=34073 RepID=UPI001932FDD8|nr:hypothetical protein INQ48_43540 [Variovorax paradoxus]